ncbi:TetR family transcriptional regulator [Actinorhabdospora filicis]|uniref:TetR family transcriptional regulator n=1 Tax=Actinorhabdospora filicis TaxID=1785913 RepID=A0A9W6SRX2_9ACTN|nr:TetR family transcriptional regulator [Actinorhabdospora filicis]
MLAARGFGGLSMRTVAAELGASTGLLTHYFPAKRDLVAHALDLLAERAATRERRVAPPGLARLRAVLLDIIPIDDAAVASNRIWVSSWDPALADPVLGADHAARYAASRDKVSGIITEAQELGELPPGDPAQTAAAVMSFALGLVVQALLDPPAFPAERQVALLDAYLAQLISARTAS